jgi:hypothetical protein
MEYNRLDALRARLEEQLRADIELLQEVHRVKLRAFETVWRAQADLAETATSAGTGERRPVLSLPTGTTETGTAQPVPRPEAWSVLFAILESWDEIPEIFDKNELARVLGFTPKRATLFRALDELRRDGCLKKESESEGRTPARFRKLSRPEMDGD